jgi:UDP-N-acetylmuramoylalanine--D-glutamate ligase
MKEEIINRKLKIGILGAGESGVGTAILAKQKEFEVFVSDFGKIKVKYKQVLIDNEIEWEEGGHSEEKLLSVDLVMKSPGIPENASIVNKLKKNGIMVISEIEFAAKFTNAIIVGITGSNGKTTTASLTYELLKHGGMNVALGGNIGKSFAQLVADSAAEGKRYKHFVLELSSFQLDGIEEFSPHIAIMTNLSPDHLDRYDYKYENYIASKFRIVMNQTEEDYFIYNADDEEINKWLLENPIKSKLLPFSTKKELKEGAFRKNNEIIIIIDNDQFTMPIATIGIQGEHNLKNAMAASAAAKLLKIRKQTIRESMQGFQGVEHRLEKVLKIHNVEYVNDSKATNVNATYFALDSMENQTIWIVGGVDKGNDYSELLPLVNEKVKAIICLGVDNEKIKNAFGNVIDTIFETTSMASAVQMAYKIAERNNTVLLSPACASFDLFENYEDRGRQFKDAVRRL